MAETPAFTRPVDWWFEDFEVGQTGGSPPGESYLLNREALIAYATEFDPQPMHLDEESAARSMLGGLAASGWQGCAILMRMIYDHLIKRTAGVGAPGVDKVEWRAPLRPGDAYSFHWEVTKTRALNSRPDCGMVTFAMELRDQTGLTKLACIQPIMILKQTSSDRLSETASPPQTPNETRSQQTHEVRERSPWATPPSTFFEDVPVGVTLELGAHTFNEAEMVRFAEMYDPQDFHLSAEKAAQTHFGRLAASGWHTASAWMRKMVDTQKRLAIEAVARGEKVAVLGPAAGFENLVWAKPVFAGDTIRYTATTRDKRTSSSKPQWGILLQHNEGFNQRGDRVFAFDAAVFLERREPG